MKEIKSVVKKRPTVLAIVVAAVLIAGFVGLWSKRQPAAPEINFTLIDGNRLSLKNLRGRPVLVFFWATTCQICITKIPEMNVLYRQLNPKGLEIIAVAMPYDPPTHVVSMATTMKMPYPVALDINADVVRAFGNVKVTPTTFLIGPKGNITWNKPGKFNIDRLGIRIQGLIQGAVAI
ncbi:MAG: peroxiredoxin family protein [Acidiferrobacterales bacterium]